MQNLLIVSFVRACIQPYKYFRPYGRTHKCFIEYIFARVMITTSKLEQRTTTAESCARQKLHTLRIQPLALPISPPPLFSPNTNNGQVSHRSLRSRVPRQRGRPRVRRNPFGARHGAAAPTPFSPAYAGPLSRIPFPKKKTRGPQALRHVQQHTGDTAVVSTSERVATPPAYRPHRSLRLCPRSDLVQRVRTARVLHARRQ